MLNKYAIIRVIEHVLCNPTKRFSIRELARITGLSVNASRYALEFMYKKDLVKLEKIGRTYQYQANLDNYIARQWKILFSLEEIENVVKMILETERSILNIILYGSVAIGKDDKNSDIDILVIADTDMKGKKVIAVAAHGTKREVNISIYSPQEWRVKASEDKIFYEHVIVDSIALYGEKPVVL
ncbi:nucleotidyltransferase domain-containing protein [Candidatus Micrarchaeota archaeon]|nr:nucleotidyltransferase domain-containing protein [Candidatus Micrarchaeota archaeon]